MSFEFNTQKDRYDENFDHSFEDNKWKGKERSYVREY